MNGMLFNVPRAISSRNGKMPVFTAEASDAEMFAEIDTIAGLIGLTASDDGSPNGHYSAIRSFGPVQYRAIAIPCRARKKGGE